MEYLRTAEGDALWKTLVATREALNETHERYQCTVAAAMDVDPGVNGQRVVRQEGRAYAEALTRHSNAAMAWLIYVDTHLHPKKAGTKLSPYEILVPTGAGGVKGLVILAQH